jgi:hypothetical protein
MNSIYHVSAFHYDFAIIVVSIIGVCFDADPGKISTSNFIGIISASRTRIKEFLNLIII